MIAARIELWLGEVNEAVVVECVLSDEQISSLSGLGRTDVDPTGVFREVLVANGIAPEWAGKVSDWSVYLDHGADPLSKPSPSESPPTASRVARCRSVLQLGERLLPPRVREEAMDEWMDEIECAAAADQPVFRRTISILLRSLPAVAWRSRMPSRVRRGGS